MQYSGNLISELLDLVESVSQRTVKRDGDDFDKLCHAKIAPADRMSEEIRDYGHTQSTTQKLWHETGKLQERVLNI